MGQLEKASVFRELVCAHPASKVTVSAKNMGMADKFLFFMWCAPIAFEPLADQFAFGKSMFDPGQRRSNGARIASRVSNFELENQLAEQCFALRFMPAAL